MPAARPWTDYEDKYLRDNWLTMSAGAIGKHLDRSRSSVLGRAHRKDLEQKPTKRNPTGGGKRIKRDRHWVEKKYGKVKKPSERNETMLERAYIPKPPPVKVSAAPTKRVKSVSYGLEPASLERTILTVGPNECRYPHGDGPFTFCGHPTDIGDSYCPFHNTLTLSPASHTMRIRHPNGIK